MQQDPAGVLRSNTHRKVLGHLSLPWDDHRWHVLQLLYRMGPDVDTTLSSPEEVEAVLFELAKDGHAESTSEGWRMTQFGFDVLTGPISHEPPPPNHPPTQEPVEMEPMVLVPASSMSGLPRQMKWQLRPHLQNPSPRRWKRKKS